jgi:hypothetical protein
MPVANDAEGYGGVRRAAELANFVPALQRTNDVASVQASPSCGTVRRYVGDVE